MIQLTSGKRLMMINGYTFHRTGVKSKSGVRWQCSGKNRGCNANYCVNEENGQILEVTAKHCHEPPQYREINGLHYKI